MSRFSIPAKIPTLRVPGNIQLPSLPSLPSPNIFPKGTLSPTKNGEPASEELVTEPGTDEGAADTPQNEELSTKSVAKTGHVVYLVMQPVIAVSIGAVHVTKMKGRIHSVLRAFLAGWIDFHTLLFMLIAQHWAVMIDGQYYHLKRMTDDSLALDMTSFAEDGIFVKIPLWKTTLTHEERAGVGESHVSSIIVTGTHFPQAIRILAVMMGKSKETGAVHVERDGHPIATDGFSFSKYRNYVNLPTTGKGGYNAVFNNCQHFVHRFFNQVFVPNGHRDVLEWPSIAKELWFSRLNKATVQDILQVVKSNNLSVRRVSPVSSWGV
jgi:hypothetical protein